MTKAKRLPKRLLTLLCAVFVVLSLSVPASADMGPKPSVRIRFEHMRDELCYGTLLSEEDSTGPASAWDGNEKEDDGSTEYAIWKAFVEYEDPDGYYYLQTDWPVSETKEIAWTYYPPSKFKILLYYPETQTFISSGIFERYAFDTYYTVDMNGVNTGPAEENETDNERFGAYRSYNYGPETLSLVARIIGTIIFELGVAIIFGFQEKKQLKILAVINIVTQVLLNVLLNIIDYRSGAFAFMVYYVLAEFLVFILEAILYCTILRKASAQPRRGGYYWVYSLVANSVSFGVGVAIARVIPGIF